MKKIPTLFERDWDGDRSRVVNQVHPGCEWVLSGEGHATRKLDGTCCMIRNHRLYKRQEVKAGKLPPDGFELADHDETTGKQVGWLAVGDGPDDRWHREAGGSFLPDGAYELIGPKINGNPEHAVSHLLVPHNDERLVLKDVPRDFDGLKGWLNGRDIEGIVFHHPDGRMAKIKLRDFGLSR